MSLRIFISRVLDPGSPIKGVENRPQVELMAESLININPISISDPPVADWYFFYSKNGVECLAGQWTEKWNTSSSHQHIRWAAMGEGTAESMRGWGINCDFVGHGDTEEIAKQFLSHSKPSESVVFFRALHSKNNLYHLIAEEREAQHIAIYDNQLIEKQFPPCDIGIFTSSRNAIAFFKNNPAPAIACIAIGQPTMETLLSLNYSPDKIFIAEEPSETALFETLMNVLES